MAHDDEVTSLGRWRGLVALVRDAVEHGSVAVERLQKETVRRPLELLQHVPGLAVPAAVARALHDASVGVTHGSVRLAARAAAGVADVLLERAERRPP